MKEHGKPGPIDVVLVHVQTYFTGTLILQSSSLYFVHPLKSTWNTQHDGPWYVSPASNMATRWVSTWDLSPSFACFLHGPPAATCAQISQSACERKDLRNTMGRRWSTCFGTKKTNDGLKWRGETMHSLQTEKDCSRKILSASHIPCEARCLGTQKTHVCQNHLQKGFSSIREMVVSDYFSIVFKDIPICCRICSSKFQEDT